MKNVLRYFRKPHRIVALLSYIFSGFGTLCILLYTNLPNWTRMAAFIMYSVLVLLALASMLRRSVLNNYLETVEQLFVKEGISIQQENIETYLRLNEVRGIEGIKEQGNYAELIDRIADAKNSIRIIVYYGNRFLYQARSKIIKAIEKDVTVQLIIAEKESDLLDEVWKLEGNEKKASWDETYKIIKEIEEQTKKRPDLFAYHICNTQIRYALVLIDNKWAWWTPYHPGVDVAETASFVLVNKGEKSIIHQCRDHFGKLWFYLDKKQRDSSQNAIG